MVVLLWTNQPSVLQQIREGDSGSGKLQWDSGKMTGVCQRWVPMCSSGPQWDVFLICFWLHPEVIFVDVTGCQTHKLQDSRNVQELSCCFLVYLKWKPLTIVSLNKQGLSFSSVYAPSCWQSSFSTFKRVSCPSTCLKRWVMCAEPLGPVLSTASVHLTILQSCSEIIQKKTPWEISSCCTEACCG